TVFVAVDHGAIALRGKTFALRVIGGGQQQATQQRRILRRGVVQRGDRFLRDEQHVHRRLRVHVAEGQQFVVLPDDVGRDLAPDDLAEDGVAHVVLLRGYRRSSIPCA